MLALHFHASEARVVERPEPTVRPGYAVVRMLRAGVCNTDLELVKGYMGFDGVLGHELVGRVEQGPDAWLGKRVAAEINFACGACDTCARGLARHCPTRTVMGILGSDGAFAELVAVPVANLHELPDGVSDDAAVFVEPLAAACEILEQIHVRPDHSCVVLGDGKLGQLVARVLWKTGASVLVVGKHPAKLALLEACGIPTVTLDAWRADRSDVVVEATGTAEGFRAAMKATRPRGTLVLKSTVADGITLSLAPLVIDEIRVVGSRCGSFAPAIRALADGSVDPLPLLSARVPLRDARDALRLAVERGALKVVVEN